MERKAALLKNIKRLLTLSLRICIGRFPYFFRCWFSTPEPPNFSLPQFKPGNRWIEVNKLSTALEDIMPIEQNVSRLGTLGVNPNQANDMKGAWPERDFSAMLRFHLFYIKMKHNGFINRFSGNM